MPNKEKFLSDIQSDNAATRFAAWRQAGEMEPAVIADLAKLVTSSNSGVGKAAREAIITMTHSVGKQDSPKRTEVVKQLVELSGTGAPVQVRVLAFRQLSLVAGEDAVPAIAKSIHDAELREEVTFCLERIPGAASNKVLIAAYRDVKPEFKPRLLAALGHRRSEEALGLVTQEMRSADREIALAALKAYGRIGKRPSSAVRLPDPKDLSDWQKVEHMDSLLRYADAQAEQGNAAEAMRVYKTALDRPEEHWQCAAIIGIAKLGTAEGAATIFPKLKSDQRNVRITAEKAWVGMAKAAAGG